MEAEIKQVAPNPGSDEAIKLGCICAVLDNQHGKGAFDGAPGTFWITDGCPLHAPKRNEVVKGRPITVRIGKQSKPMAKKCIKNKQHVGPMKEIYRSSIGLHDDGVVRWCPNCGAVAIDIDTDGRVNPGGIMRMDFPQAISPEVAEA